MKNNYINNRTKLKFDFKDYLVFAILSWFALDALRVKINFTVIVIIYILFLVVSNRRIKNVFIYIFPFFIYNLNILLRTVLGYKVLTSELIYGTILVMISSVFFLYTTKDNYKKQRVLYNVVLTSYVISAIITINFLRIDKDLIRRAASNLLNSDYYLGIYGNNVLLIGGWDFVYSLVGLEIVLLNDILIKYKEKSRKIFPLIALFVLFLVVIIYSSLSTAFLFLVFNLIIYFIPEKKSKRIIYFISLFASLLIVIPFINYVLSNLLTKLDNPNYIYKLNSFIKLLNHEISFTQFYSRFYYIKNSVNTFLNNFITGIYGYISFNHELISGHSQWIDDFARYGFPTQLLFYIGFYIYYKRLSLLKGINLKVKRTILIYVSLLGFLNPAMLIHIYLLLFVILPFGSNNE